MSKIYKYLSYEDALRTIENNSVVLKNPSTYNDPFDSRVEIKNDEEHRCFNLIIEFFLFYCFVLLLENDKLKLTKPQKIIFFFVKPMMKLYIKSIKKGGAYFSNPFLRLLVRLTKNHPIMDKIYNDKQIEFVNKVNEIVEEVRVTALVSCFSKKSDSILMWSHYANKHEGVCIEFERPKDNFYDVIYQSKRVSFNLYEITSRVLCNILINKNIDINTFDFNNLITYDSSVIKKILYPFLVKSFDWEYEDEVRCIFTSDEKNDNISITPDGTYLLKMPYKINKIILGCKLDPVKEQEIRRILQRTNIHIVKMQTSIEKFLLEELQ